MQIATGPIRSNVKGCPFRMLEKIGSRMQGNCLSGLENCKTAATNCQTTE